MLSEWLLALKDNSLVDFPVVALADLTRSQLVARLDDVIERVEEELDAFADDRLLHLLASFPALHDTLSPPIFSRFFDTLLNCTTISLSRHIVISSSSII